jgi:hypothetical protein
MLSAQESFFGKMLHPVKVRIFMLVYLPSAFFSGVLPVKANEKECTVRVPFKWFSRNPFRSTYFACLAMAAEMSTGILPLSLIHKRKPGISMLVTKLEANYFKKATGTTWFTCAQGLAFKEVIEDAVRDGQSHEFIAESVGRNAEGAVVAVFKITWSFKSRT